MDAPATGLTELLARRFLTTDDARAEKVAARHAAGRRTARENIADLVDPDSFVEYGRFATAAQEQVRPLADLVVETPADGIVGGTATVAGRPVTVMSYDWMVAAGTQGMRGHHKSDRLIDLAIRTRTPAVFFTEGGGGRPSDTDYPLVSALDVGSFGLWARLGEHAPRIAVVSGRCFAGNAVIAGTADLRVATPEANLGMAGPAMIAGGGLGQVAADDIGPIAEQAEAGVVDVVVEDEAEAVVVVRALLDLLSGQDAPSAPHADQVLLRESLPSNDREAFDVRPLIDLLADLESLVWLRESYAPELVTALGRLDGMAVGFMANSSAHVAGALTASASAKGADFLEFCQRWGLPVVSLVDTPGFMVGPDAERTGLVRHASRLVSAGARVSTPLVGVVLRRGYGLGAQAMLGGSTHCPLITLAWPQAHLGPMGLEGAVRLALAKQLATMEPEAAEALVAEQTDAMREHAKALNAARMLEIDDVIDPAETRTVLAATIRRARHGVR